MKWRGASDPTWITPKTRPRARSGAPSSDLIPFSRRMGLSTFEWSTSSIAIDLSLRRETPREALADRDANAGFDLLLETRRGTCDELLSDFVEQEDRARVGFENRAHADHELVEQLG